MGPLRMRGACCERRSRSGVARRSRISSTSRLPRNEIGRLEELRLVALEQRLEADLALGRDAEVVPELEALVREHPLRENLRGLLILALYRAGRQADALAAYQDARATLVEELGLDPGQALQRLEKAILVHDPSLDLTATAGLQPAPVLSVRSHRTEATSHDTAKPPRVALSARAQRKVVTVLFADVMGSTELGESLDPEALRALLAAYFERMKAAAEAPRWRRREVHRGRGDGRVRRAGGARGRRAPRASGGGRDAGRDRGARDRRANRRSRAARSSSEPPNVL